MIVGTFFLAAAGLAAAAALRGPSSPPDTAAGTTTTSILAAPSPTTLPPGTTHTLPPRPSTTAETATTQLPSTVTTGSGGGTPVDPAAESGFVVVIDPGHQRRGNNSQEPIGPGASETKAKVSSGTSGVATGVPEGQLTLSVGLKLRDALKARGVKVIMTRTSQDVDISNVERTQIANQAHADLYIRIHADGSDSGATRGIHVLYPASIPGWTDDVAAASRRAAELARAALVAATGAPDRGLDARKDMTGFNWSDVPVILPEIGFMTNSQEDRLLNDDAYQDKIAGALAEAALRFLEER
ncbi:MAG: N-acetylmuramoyl-L-alanine amidase [Thermoleophilia bacterium]